MVVDFSSSFTLEGWINDDAFSRVYTIWVISEAGLLFTVSDANM